MNSVKIRHYFHVLIKLISASLHIRLQTYDHLTPKVPKQRVQLEASEVGRGGKRGACSVGCWVECCRAGQDDGTRANGEEADEDGAQDKHDHQEDEKGGLGIDVGSHQAHQQAQQGHTSGVEQRPPVA